MVGDWLEGQVFAKSIARLTKQADFFRPPRGWLIEVEPFPMGNGDERSLAAAGGAPIASACEGEQRPQQIAGRGNIESVPNVKNELRTASCASC